MEEVKKTGLTFIDTRRLANIAYKDIKNGFVGFGYYLKIIRDEKLWQGQGYDSFNEFLGGKWNRHETYNRHPDSETELVEFLKEIQKCSDAGAISTRRLMRNI